MNKDHSFELPSESIQPMGERVIGLIDPRGLTKDEFDKSPDVLYHGATGAFEFSHTYDFESPRESDGSRTLGAGFYASLSRRDAIEYSKMRFNEEGHVVTVVPYQAKMLDFRVMNHPEENAPVSLDFVQAWRDYYVEYQRTHPGVATGNVAKMIEKMRTEHVEYLGRILEKRGKVNVRMMLETAPNPDFDAGGFGDPPWGEIFRQFMVSRGYDGVIYNEGGEGQVMKGGGASYVFYNPAKVGTFESWQSRK